MKSILEQTTILKKFTHILNVFQEVWLRNSVSFSSAPAESYGKIHTFFFKSTASPIHQNTANHWGVTTAQQAPEQPLQETSCHLLPEIDVVRFPGHLKHSSSLKDSPATILNVWKIDARDLNLDKYFPYYLVSLFLTLVTSWDNFHSCFCNLIYFFFIRIVILFSLLTK